MLQRESSKKASLERNHTMEIIESQLVQLGERVEQKLIALHMHPYKREGLKEAGLYKLTEQIRMSGRQAVRQR